MNQIKPVGARTLTIGDAAVDGLMNGVAAGLVMALYLMLAEGLGGRAPWEVLPAFDPSSQGSPLVGLVMHLAVSGVYGTVFGALWKLSRSPVSARLPGWLVGAGYGLLLFGIALAVVLPGAAPALKAIPVLHFAIAHLLYGLTLGSLMARLPF